MGKSDFQSQLSFLQLYCSISSLKLFLKISYIYGISRRETNTLPARPSDARMEHYYCRPNEKYSSTCSANDPSQNIHAGIPRSVPKKQNSKLVDHKGSIGENLLGTAHCDVARNLLVSLGSSRLLGRHLSFF